MTDSPRASLAWSAASCPSETASVGVSFCLGETGPLSQGVQAGRNGAQNTPYTRYEDA
jgi:hypothetical protein